MFAPTKTWRKWNAKLNTNQKRFAVASALAASALPSLVMARGHKIDNVPEVPLVVDDSFQSIAKTKKALEALKGCGADCDVTKAKESRKIRAGVGKMRNRRHVQRRGPLVVFAEDHGITQAFRNLPGVELAHVDRLNLLQLAPGGHLGRFIIWTQSAFTKLNGIYGSVTRESTQKKGYTLPRPIMTNPDVTRLINSDEVQSKVRPALLTRTRYRKHKNPLENFGVKVKLNPYAMALRRSELLAQEAQATRRAQTLELARKNQPAPAAPGVAEEKKHRKRHHKRAIANYKVISA
jgi:large subunit ribosomal protein L4e